MNTVENPLGVTFIQSGDTVIIIKEWFQANNKGGTAGVYTLVPFLYIEK